MRFLGARLSELTFGLGDLEGVFQPKWFCDSMKRLLPSRGAGEFGSVVEGRLAQPEDTPQKVAVKTMKRKSSPWPHRTRHWVAETSWWPLTRTGAVWGVKALGLLNLLLFSLLPSG